MARTHFLQEGFRIGPGDEVFLLVPKNVYNDPLDWIFHANSRQQKVLEQLPYYGEEARIPKTTGNIVGNRRLRDVTGNSPADFYIVCIP